MNKHSTYVYLAAVLFLLLVAAGIFGPVYASCSSRAVLAAL